MKHLEDCLLIEPRKLTEDQIPCAVNYRAQVSHADQEASKVSWETGAKTWVIAYEEMIAKGVK